MCGALWGLAAVTGCRQSRVCTSITGLPVAVLCSAAGGVPGHIDRVLVSSYTIHQDRGLAVQAILFGWLVGGEAIHEA